MNKTSLRVARWVNQSRASRLVRGGRQHERVVIYVVQLADKGASDTF
jgi:hypothetical protein